MTAAASVDAKTAAERFLNDSQCGKPRCKCALSARRGHGLTHCPVHTDNTPSFNVTVKGDRLLVCCEAGCPQADVITALKDGGVWPQKAEYGKQILAEYDYQDAAGTLLYQSLRYFPKDFKQRKPNGSGGWDWSLGDLERVPYRLPELIASGQRIVFIPEGEKDVDRLMALGFVATCNVGGAGKWRDEYSSYLKGRPAVIVPDNDEAGLQHSLQVARSLKGIAQSVRWLALPELDDHGDVSDWLDDGHTVEELRQLATDAPGPPDPPKRERVFRTEGLGYRFEPAGLPVVMRFSRLADRRDETTAEMAVSRADGAHILRRRVNLLASTGTTLKGLAEDLSVEQLGIDVDWSKIVRDGFESVLDAHRNGVVVESVKGDLTRPLPPQWLCEPLLLKDKVNCWLGAAGTGKSTLAKVLCTYYAAGYRFLDLPMAQGLPLYLDWEDDLEDLKRVAHDTCRNLGVWPVPEVLWMKMRGKRLRDNVEFLARLVDERKVGLMVMDAIAAAGGSPGEHMSWEAIALELEQCLGMLPPVTVLGLDHVTSEEHKQGSAAVPTKARGAERKVEFFRNQWSLVVDRDELEFGRHVVAWHHTKVNTIVPRPPFVTQIIHRDGELSVVKKGIDASPAAVERLPYQKQNVLYVREHPGKTAESICIGVRGESTKSKIDSTRNELNRAARRKEIYVDDAGCWWPAQASGEVQSADPTPLPFDADTHADTR